MMLIINAFISVCFLFLLKAGFLSDESALGFLDSQIR